eukprot:CAMPEP_0119467392 /NCGR_PEP_ID=MMETSP1344-20130328/1598_1 /TAXON_ID=236787 /ORGANISM="Florenciella parvula, Strain CCMP2471" /LENGTH=102 /DNA_ID=CAMNT_0007499753 /DNA_START=26 /DNA_END=334 /DNA_ORIENTATION=-
MAALRGVIRPAAAAVRVMPKRFMGAAEPFEPAKAAPANIVKAREVLCAGGTWNGAGGAGPTWLKDGMGDQVVGGIALGAFLWGMTGFFGGLYKMGYGVGKLD